MTAGTRPADVRVDDQWGDRSESPPRLGRTQSARPAVACNPDRGREAQPPISVIRERDRSPAYRATFAFKKLKQDAVLIGAEALLPAAQHWVWHRQMHRSEVLRKAHKIEAEGADRKRPKQATLLFGQRFEEAVPGGEARTNANADTSNRQDGIRVGGAIRHQL